jgi:hypothetical protein
MFVLALLFSSLSVAAPKTTAPGKNVQIYFIITDQKIVYAIYRQTANGAGDLFLEQYVVRGDFATFVVVNRGKKVHNFVFFGKKIPLLKPGARVRFRQPLVVRGSFPYASTVDKGKAFRGVFTIY